MPTKRLLLAAFISIFFCLSLFLACKKDIRDKHGFDYSTDEFTVKTARGYFYKHVKKQFAASTSNFNKALVTAYPFWQKAYYGKSRFNEYVEVPLFYKNKMAVRILTGNPAKRPESKHTSFDRLVIYRGKSGKISQVIVSYIPDESYLQRHHYDVSNNRIGKLDDDFQGWLIYRKINGRVNFILKIENGKAVRKLQINHKPSRPGETNTRTQEYCEYPFIDHQEQDCTYTAPDGPEGPIYENCGEWYSVWVEWLEPICEAPDDPCYDPANFCTAECNYDCDWGDDGIDDNQFTYDDLWLNEIKDSTGDPCDTKVITDLKSLTATFPDLFRNIFGASANINITFKSANLGSGEGGNTTPNYTNNNFVITLNNYFSDASSLSVAATILHEMVHAQLMNWYREAVTENNVARQEYLATEYYLFFDSASVAQYPDLSFITLMNQNQGGQHQIQTMGNIRAAMSDALYNFALLADPSTTVDRLYCDDLAWTGTGDAQGFKSLPQSERDRLTTIIEGERGNTAVSPDYTQKGKPCP